MRGGIPSGWSWSGRCLVKVNWWGAWTPRQGVRRSVVVLHIIADGPAGPVIHLDTSRRRRSLPLLFPLPWAPMVSSLIIIEPIVFIITVGVLLLDQPLHLLLSSSTTRLRERCHIVSCSVIQQKASSNAIRILFFNKTITEEDLARLGQSLKLWGYLPIPPAI